MNPKAELLRKLKAAWRNARAPKWPLRNVHRWRGRKFVTIRSVTTGSFTDLVSGLTPAGIQFSQPEAWQIFESEFSS